MSEPKLPPARYERSDVDPRWIYSGFAALLVALAICAFVATWLFPGATVDKRVALPLPEYPKPRLQIDPTADLQAFLKEETAQLNSNGWTDQAHGVAHIPIDEAMRRIAAQGIPDWPVSKEPHR